MTLINGVNFKQAATLKPFNFRLSCKADNYNDEQRVRHTVRSVSNISFAEQSKRKLAEIEQAGMELPPFISKSKYLS